MNYYNEIKEKLLKSEIYDRVKNYAKEQNRVITYFEIGRLLSEAGKEYGKNIIKQYSDKLVIEVGKKYNTRTLRKIRQFYEVFKNEKWSTLWTKLNWSHYREVMSIKDINEIRYYLTECEDNNLTQRQLHDLIKQDRYNRLTVELKNKLINKEELKVKDLVPNPIIIKSDDTKEKLSEYALKEKIINNLDSFLNQLGIGFSYLGNEYKIKLGDRYNYIDLLLYNIEYKCYVVVELKVTELRKEHIGQIEVYMNYIDMHLKKASDNKTIGIIIVKKNNKFIIDYSSNDKIITREYILI